jgi:uncharacterized protein
MSQLRIDVADLLSHPGTRRDVSAVAELDALRGPAAAIVGPVEVTASLERVPEGIVVRGEIAARWQSECSVCLRDITRRLSVHVDELFEASPVEGETYPLEGHELDLEQLARDSLLVELPLAPHCEEPCRATTRSLSDADEPADPRWAPLAELEL